MIYLVTLNVYSWLRHGGRGRARVRSSVVGGSPPRRRATATLKGNLHSLAAPRGPSVRLKIERWKSGFGDFKWRRQTSCGLTRDAYVQLQWHPLHTKNSLEN